MVYYINHEHLTHFNKTKFSKNTVGFYLLNLYSSNMSKLISIFPF